jgi:hypothetical protein
MKKWKIGKEEGHVNMEEEIKVMLPQTKGCQRWLGTPEVEEVRKDSSIEPSERMWPCRQPGLLVF